MMWDFSGGAASGQAAPPFPQSQPRAIPRPPSPPYTASPGGFAVSAPSAPQPFMPIGGPDDYYNPGGYPASTYATSYNPSYVEDTGPWVVPPSSHLTVPRGPPAGGFSHYTSYSRYSHSYAAHQSHSQPSKPSGHHHSGSHAPRPAAHHATPSKPIMPALAKPPKVQRPQAVQRPLLASSSGGGHCSQCTGRRKALCIGINYKGQQNELLGCVNDAKNVQRFLHSNIDRGYDDEDIVVLTDDANNPRLLPTRANIIREMYQLVRGAQPHDSLFFHYSGHGSQVKDLNGDEIDGYDEVIFPLDYQRNGHISDDRMHDILVKSLPPQCRLTALFDSCHSGSALDLPYLYSTNGRVKESQVTDEWFDEKRTDADVISWSGCKDSQTSADTWENGVATGAMSHAFMKSIRQNPNQTYQELLRSIRSILKKKYSQKPQLSSSHRVDTNVKFIF